RPGQGQAGRGQGPVPAEDLAELDHGRRRGRGPGLAGTGEVNSFTRPGESSRAVVFEGAGTGSPGPEPSKTAGAVRARRRRAGKHDWQGFAVAASGTA